MSKRSHNHLKAPPNYTTKMSTPTLKIKTTHTSRGPFSPLPSELPRTPIVGHFDSLKSHEECLKTPITPPAAYTDFLRNTANSPALCKSPGAFFPPNSAKSLLANTQGYYTPTTPYSLAPTSAARRLRIPSSPASAANYSPSTESPASATSRSSEEETEVEARSPRTGPRVTVKQVVTTTVTFTPRMSLMPAPKGKRRRIE